MTPLSIQTKLEMLGVSTAKVPTSGPGYDNAVKFAVELRLKRIEKGLRYAEKQLSFAEKEVELWGNEVVRWKLKVEQAMETHHKVKTRHTLLLKVAEEQLNVAAESTERWISEAASQAVQVKRWTGLKQQVESFREEFSSE